MISKEKLISVFMPANNEAENLPKVLEKIDNAFKKYKIKYLLVDKSIQNSVSRGPIDYASLESFLN